MLKTLLIDHYDSFSWNVKAWLSHYFSVEVISYDDINSVDLKLYSLIVLSPGPKHPQDYPDTITLLKNIENSQAVLGICLGMQCMAFQTQNEVCSYAPPYHGKTSQISLLFKNGSQQITRVARYHSLKCNIDHSFDVLAQVENQIPMIIKHKSKNWLGLQFHPESFLTDSPDDMITYIKENLNL